MTLQAWGFGQAYPPEVGARFHELNTMTYKGQKVARGFDVTAGPGSALTVSNGAAVMPGLLVEDSSAASVPITTAHRSKSNLLVLDADWTANAGAGSIGLNLVQGGSTFPAPVQQAGKRWQMPLARVVVSSNGSITTLETCKPTSATVGPPMIGTGDGAGQASPGVTKLLRTVAVSDPGWPYWLEIKADARTRGVSNGSVNGYAELAIRFNNNPIAGTPVQVRNQTTWEFVAVFGSVRSAQSGSSTVSLMGGVQTGGGLTEYQQATLEVIQHPAF